MSACVISSAGRWVAVCRTRAGLSAACLVLVLAACSHSAHGPTAPSTSPPAPTPHTSSLGLPRATSAHPSSSALANQCRIPTARAATSRRIAVGEAGAPAAGPFSFHTYPYMAGLPTKMIISADRKQQEPVVLRGFNCADRTPLRFWYDKGLLPGDPQLPLTQKRMETIGDLAEHLPPIPANTDHTGYVLFSSVGDWLITLSIRGTPTDSLLITVVAQ